MSPLRFAGAGLTLVLGACNMAGESSNESGLRTQAADAPADSAPLAGIYVARQAPSDLSGMRARFAGRWGVRGNCLIFEGGEVIYLPVLARSTPVTVFADRVEIGGRSHRFGREAVIVGGAADSSAATILDEQPPPSCAYPLLRVSGIQ